MRLKAGVEDSFYRRVTLQEASDLHRVLIVTRDAQLESLQATKQEIGGEGIEGCAVDLAVVVNPPHEFLWPAQDAAEGVRVPTEVLCGAVEHEVRPQCERALVYRGSEGAVHHDDRPGLTPGFGEATNVDELERRVRRRLQVQEIAAPCDLFFDGVGVRGVEQLHLHSGSG